MEMRMSCELTKVKKETAGWKVAAQIFFLTVFDQCFLQCSEESHSVVNVEQKSRGVKLIRHRDCIYALGLKKKSLFEFTFDQMSNIQAQLDNI